nr:hypothetical protein [Nostoc sp. ChiQUE02]
MFKTLNNPELGGEGGCWAIVTQVNDFSCTVRLWDGELTVGVQHLKSYEYLPQECQQMQVICDRIHRLQENENLEDAPSAVLKHLGELKRPYLTAVEEKLLSLIGKSTVLAIKFYNYFLKNYHPIDGLK